MLKGISPLISPRLLSILYRMGHGDQIILADAHFPGHSSNSCVVRADGLEIGHLLEGILPLFEIDSYVERPVLMMAPVKGDSADPLVKAKYESILKKYYPDSPSISELDRFDFYRLAKDAFSVVMTGDTAKYGNLVLTKGVTPLL